MTMQSRIQDKIQTALQPDMMQLLNESHNHNVRPGSESHFKLTVVSALFDGKTPVKRHQMIYGLLAEELRGGVHALALHLYTPSEWQATGQAPASPPCLGGSKG